MMKAAEDLKQQQLLKEQERQRILQERIIPLPNVDSMDDHGPSSSTLFLYLVFLKKPSSESEPDTSFKSGG